jgi:hypothetical protein
MDLRRSIFERNYEGKNFITDYIDNLKISPGK